MDKELNSLIGMELKSQMLDSRNDIQRTNKLVNGTKITMSLNELNNSDNFEDGKPSNTLFTYVTSPEYFEPQSPQYKKLKNDTITSLMMKRELTYLIQFKILTQTRKLQLSECLAIMLNMRY